VDDGSTDGTAAAVARLQRRHSRVPAVAGAAAEAPAEQLRLLRLSGGGPAGKPFALAHGIDAARGEIILTTDADCEAGPGWIRAMVDTFGPDTAFVSGPVLYRPGATAFARMQALEFLGLIAVGAGAIGLRRPILCNSANLAYRRDVYERLGRLDPAHPVGPGDDEVLIQRIAAETDWGVRFCGDAAAAVWTDPAPGVAAFFAPRRRWARTTLRYPGAALLLQLVALYAFFVGLVAGAAAAAFVPALWPAVGLAVGLKVAAEAGVLVPACRHFGQRALLPYGLPAQPLHVLYRSSPSPPASSPRPAGRDVPFPEPIPPTWSSTSPASSAPRSPASRPASSPMPSGGCRTGSPSPT
jgi:hypothetical protein